jgi:hypothetical protein
MESHMTFHLKARKRRAGPGDRNEEIECHMTFYLDSKNQDPNKALQSCTPRLKKGRSVMSSTPKIQRRTCPLLETFQTIVLDHLGCCFETSDCDLLTDDVETPSR